jgi:hypothetical protein
MDNSITLDAANNDTFFGPLASAYSYKRELRSVVDQCFQAAQHSTNWFFVLEGSHVVAAQTTLKDAMDYMTAESTLLDCSAVPQSRRQE